MTDETIDSAPAPVRDTGYTYATVIIADADRLQAQADLDDQGLFNTPLSASGSAPATHWMSSGPFYNYQLDDIINVYTWPNAVYFGQDWQYAVSQQNLQIVQIEDQPQ